MKSPAYDLAIHLVAQGVGTLAGAAAWAINISREPDLPDNTVTLYDTGGEAPDTEQFDIFRPTIQVRVRARKEISAGIDVGYSTAYTKHEEIRDLLLLPLEIVTAEWRYFAISMTSEVESIARDEKDRHLLVANYRCLRERN